MLKNSCRCHLFLLCQTRFGSTPACFQLHRSKLNHHTSKDSFVDGSNYHNGNLGRLVGTAAFKKLGTHINALNVASVCLPPRAES